MTAKKQFLRKLKARQPAAANRTFTQYQNDPVAYFREVLGADLTADQAAIVESVRDNRYTVVKASHAVGKTFTAGGTANWWYDCWDQNIVYITAPSWKQALGLTFKEIKRVRRKRKLSGDILDSGMVRDPDKEREPGHFIRALNAKSGEGFQGEHTAPILIILEEAVGVPHYIWEAAAGLMTHPECRLLAIANPTDEANDFGELVGKGDTHTLTISALEHPNVQAELHGTPPPFPKAVRLLWLYEMLRDECQVVAHAGSDTFEWYSLAEVEKASKGQPADLTQRCLYLPNAAFQGRVLGQFPTQAADQVIPRGWIESTDPIAEPTGAVEIGCDVARFGTDRTCIVVRRGAVVLDLLELRQLDNNIIAGELQILAKHWATQFKVQPKEIPIKIDITGGLGTGPLDMLLDAGYNAVGVNSSESALEADTYPNRRSELWFTTRDYAKDKQLDLSWLPGDLRERLIKELAAPKWKPDKRGRKVVESKDDMKKRLGHSPDLADALNLAFAGWVPPGIRWITSSATE